MDLFFLVRAHPPPQLDHLGFCGRELARMIHATCVRCNHYAEGRVGLEDDQQCDPAACRVHASYNAPAWRPMPYDIHGVGVKSRCWGPQWVMQGLAGYSQIHLKSIPGPCTDIRDESIRKFTRARA